MTSLLRLKALSASRLSLEAQGACHTVAQHLRREVAPTTRNTRRRLQCPMRFLRCFRAPDLYVRDFRPPPSFSMLFTISPIVEYLKVSSPRTKTSTLKPYGRHIFSEAWQLHLRRPGPISARPRRLAPSVGDQLAPRLLEESFRAYSASVASSQRHHHRPHCVQGIFKHARRSPTFLRLGLQRQHRCQVTPNGLT